MDSQCFMMEQMLLQTYFDIIPFHIYVVDVSTFEILFVNKIMRERYLDIDMSRPCHEVLYKESTPCSHCKIRALTDSEGHPIDHLFAYEYYSEMQERWYQMHEKSLSWPDGRIVKYTIAVDISDQKMTQNQLAEAHAELALRNRGLKKKNELLQENVRLREDMERMMHHDLKGPLSPILSIPDMYLEDDSISGDVRNAFELISRAGNEILDMINHSQSMILLERGTYRLKSETFDVLDQMVKVSTMFDSHVRYMKLAFNFTLEGKPLAYGDAMTIFAEKLLCHSMFSNLVKNAVEASPEEGRIDIDISRQEREVVVSITNKGEVPEVIRKRFFEKYATSGKTKGTGLGTYSAFLIARAHGGRVELDSSVTGSTTVCVVLPQVAGIS